MQPTVSEIFVSSTELVQQLLSLVKCHFGSNRLLFMHEQSRDLQK